MRADVSIHSPRDRGRAMHACAVCDGWCLDHLVSAFDTHTESTSGSVMGEVPAEWIAEPGRFVFINAVARWKARGQVRSQVELAQSRGAGGGAGR